MALEFGAIKCTLKELLIRQYDHTFFVDSSDDFKRYLDINDLKFHEIDGPPTTEAIAKELARESQADLPPGAPLLSVTVEEGPENSATWTPPPIMDIEDWQGQTIARVRG